MCSSRRELSCACSIYNTEKEPTGFLAAIKLPLLDVYLDANFVSRAPNVDKFNQFE